uniref:Uncharacterized protein n=1 Tax=Oryza sativa subsp. japonica TaxID=39947 RepID=Q6K8J2_ORYSJ|nr:hypothetical protein [Oryza sativa Japonica Group]
MCGRTSAHMETVVSGKRAICFAPEGDYGLRRPSRADALLHNKSAAQTTLPFGIEHEV